MCKTEGNGLVNGFSRGFATQTFETLLSDELDIPRRDIAEKVALVMSGGCEGVLSPYATIFTKEEMDREEASREKRLKIGVGCTRDLLPEEIGGMPQVVEVAKTVRAAMNEASIEDPADVHFVQVKCPLLTLERINDAVKRGKEVVVTDSLKSMAYSRGASALGVALALVEVEESKLGKDVICRDFDLYSNVASASAGIELLNCHVILMGNSRRSISRYVIGHSVMEDAIDVEGVKRAIKSVGVKFDCCPRKEASTRIVNVFAKTGPHPTGRIRGRRSTMLTDFDISSTRHARAAVGAVISSIVGDPMVYVSGGSEHQGPPDGGPVAVIMEVERR
ncbi:MAG: ring-opening amidohydrolase [Candidatus Bathyarchaeia archaeon]